MFHLLGTPLVPALPDQTPAATVRDYDSSNKCAGIRYYHSNQRKVLSDPLTDTRHRPRDLLCHSVFPAWKRDRDRK